MVMEVEGEKGVEEWEIGAEDQAVQEGPRKTSSDDVSNQNGVVQEVIPTQFTEGSRSTLSKKKRRKSMRKKHPGISSSHSDPRRPKKRQSEGSDPFDIDRFIFTEPTHLVFEKSAGDQDREFVTPDLNTRVDVNDAGDVSVEVGAEERPTTGQVNFPIIDLAEEV
ncbi:hypothetical protein Hanom_Chr04g00290091 [Helianthus anomalus]